MRSTYDVCIVGLKCFDYLTRKSLPRYLGGVERQLVTLARVLSESGMRVAFVTYASDAKKKITVDNIDVFPSYSPESGVPILRFLYPRLYCIWKTLRNIDSEIVVQMGASAETGAVAIGSKFRAQPKRFVFFAASDSDCSESTPLLGVFRERAMYRYGLRSADTVVAQTNQQSVMFRNSFGMSSQVVPLPCIPLGTIAMPANGRHKSMWDAGRRRVLWIGRIDKAKRVHMLLDVAKLCPDVEFDLVGDANSESTYARNIVKIAKDIRNLTLHGKVSDSNLPSLYHRAGVLCCTSEIEGFPTTFMEAWANSLPVITSFDPDNIVSTNNVGRVFKSTEKLAVAITKGLGSEVGLVWSRNARQYYDSHYSPDACFPRIRTLFESSRSRDR